MLRPYQLEAVDSIRTKFRSGTRKLLLVAPTGSGKTVIFSEILKGCARKETHAIMVVRGRKLVDQASHRLDREGVKHGVMMSGHPNWHPLRKIQICSVDTLRSRKLRPEAKIVVVDEAHLAGSRSFVDFLNLYPESFILGVTATPYVEKSIRHVADEVIETITMKDLIADGYLLPPKYYAPHVPNLSRIEVNQHDKDYNKRQLSDFMSENKLVGNIVEHWKKLGQNRPTVCFAVTIAHSEEIVRQFLEAGIMAEHCDADTPERERNAAIERLRIGKTKIISNVGLFGIGVDIPFLGCIIMARPTKSEALYIQQAGRGTRICPEVNKKDFIILDHAGNVITHGFIDEERKPRLDGKTSRRHKEVRVRICKECYAVVSKLPCSECGWIPTAGDLKSSIDVDESKSLKEMDPNLVQKKFAPAHHSEILEEIRLLDEKVERYGFKLGFVWHKIKEKYGGEVAKRYLGHRFQRSTLESRQELPPGDYKIRP